MIDLCSRWMIHWPYPWMEENSWQRYAFAFTHYFSCPLERSFFLLRHDLIPWGVASSF